MRSFVSSEVLFLDSLNLSVVQLEYKFLPRTKPTYTHVAFVFIDVYNTYIKQHINCDNIMEYNIKTNILSSALSQAIM